MKYALIALAATAITGASANNHHRRHNHNLLKRNAPDACSCKTYVTSYVVPVTVYPEGQGSATVSPADETTTRYVTHVETSTSMRYFTATETPYTAPTPEASTCSSTGVYTFPAKTTTLSTTAYGAVPTSAVLVPGTTTYGGHTTIVATSTVITCPVVATHTSEGVTTEKVYKTVYTCPAAGTYTVGATTTVVPETTTVTYAIPTAYAPGTYVQPELTTTVTETDYVVTCPYSAIGETPAPTPAAPTTTPAAPYKVASEVAYKASEVYSKATSKASHYIPKVTSIASVVPKPSSGSTVPSGHGKYFGITYSPYDDNGQCKSATDIASDMADIASKGFENVRVYSTDCDTLKQVGDNCRKHGMGMIAGLFIKSGGVHTADEQLAALKEWNGWDLVRAVIVGNEAVFNGYCTASDLASYIEYVKAELKNGPGYSGPVSTAETLNILQANGNVLCSCIDFVGVNIQPYFDGGVVAEMAGEFLASQLKLAEDVCGGKEGYVLEAGWPSSGNPNGKAVASPENQKTAILSYENVCPGHVTYFTYRNDLWKAPGNLGIEQEFGCGDLF